MTELRKVQESEEEDGVKKKKQVTVCERMKDVANRLIQ